MKLYKKLTEAESERSNVQALKINVKGEDFPQNLLDFVNLEELYLEGMCNSFPKSTPQWNKLKVLSIKWPNFSGDLSFLFTLPALEILKIIDTPLKTFILPLGHVTAPLKSLTVKDCNLEKIPEEISMLHGLTDINFSGNKLTKLPAAFPALKALNRLNLDHNEFFQFPDLIKSMPKLIHLSIDQNKFSEEEKARIQREFNIWVN